MLRRSFLKSLSAFFLFPAFNIKSRTWTFGGWFLTQNKTCYEFWHSYGNAHEKDIFLSGQNRFKGRGFYCFAWEGVLDDDSIFRLFNECKNLWLPVVK